MTNAQTGTLVLQDRAGNYFLVPQETLEQGRVAEEHKAQVEQLITEQQEVQGFEGPIGLLHLIPVAVIATGAYLVGREIYNQGKGPIGPAVKRAWDDYQRTHPQ